VGERTDSGTWREVSSLKIDPSRLHNIARSTVGRIAGTGGVEGARSTAGAAGAGAGTDRLSLSHRADEIKAVRAALAEAPEVRAQRVAELKAQIESGSYKVDAHRVAERILNPRV